MRALVAFAALLALAGAASAATLAQHQHIEAMRAALQDPEVAFVRWMAEHGKGYANDINEYKLRLSIFTDNLRYINSHNEKQSSYWLGLNSLADLTTEEYSQLLGYEGKAEVPRSKRNTPFRHADVSLEDLPESIDWRVKGAVAEVKNQGQCGSCWAFSATGAVEGIHQIVNGELVSLSEQELVDCSRENNGCGGGLMDNAFFWILKNGGIDTEEDYAYFAKDGLCDRAKRRKRAVLIDGFEDVPSEDEKALKKAVAKQPVAVAIQADVKSFQLYKGGVYSDPQCGTQLNHGVLAVGYGTEGGEEYWIVKNSWGAEWGDQGYIKIKAQIQNPVGMCGIALVPSYPTISAPHPPRPPAGEPPIKCPFWMPSLLMELECPAGTQCCCKQYLMELCSWYACCPFVDGVCCPTDYDHCCPKENPQCDLSKGVCAAIPEAGVEAAEEIPMAKNFPPRMRSPLWEMIFGKPDGDDYEDV